MKENQVQFLGFVKIELVSGMKEDISGVRGSGSRGRRQANRLEVKEGC